MRIISGRLKGRRLYTPLNRQIRPTSDKVKEAIFSMIAGYIGEGIIAADVFSGTGNLGLEAISRGAELVYFGDRSRESLALTRQNISYCKVEEQSVVLPGDYKQVLDRISNKIDVFFLDPPYQDGVLVDCMQTIFDLDLLERDGVIVAEHDSKEKLPDSLAGFRILKQKEYGNIAITIYVAQEDIE
ncbi:16S rRNA (guanine(966)-N(2))-methyltransferase RsmD [Sinanaerobacter sp. ZZT-01]|uniref:16S rRNA (guanine(966)-N(2))-methyltransferase RsmD n=1 Tax=Sinanaerobacter sp. ZZT-01 TaxID=3111540 RepID=UPI002D780759|nr:16S rRNA (guanine(966)-N(2))-methyltransferase RsmD [Sinanaerobacter sp. ZZT-01]WRR93061.1 16S rRNA (guanine(966)-N(2))-methyltransferase RsmD [Sinanaerobacter sp. ZZT-01]